MDRRTLLRTGAVAVTGVAGCLGDLENRVGGQGPGTERPDGGAEDNATSYSLPVPREDLEYGASRDAIPAIVEPRFASDWSDLVSVRTPGAGGYGDPANRDPEAVREDVALGKVSADAARTEYGVEVEVEGTGDAEDCARGVTDRLQRSPWDRRPPQRAERQGSHERSRPVPGPCRPGLGADPIGANVCVTGAERFGPTAAVLPP